MFCTCRKEEKKKKDNDEPNYCSECKKFFKNKRTLQRHIKNHNSGKPFSCPFCFKSFSRTAIWKVHMRIHTGERPFSCSYCDKVFATNGNLKLHLRMKCSVVFQFEMYHVSKTSEESSQEKSETLKKHLHVHTREQWWATHVVDCSFYRLENEKSWYDLLVLMSILYFQIRKYFRQHGRRRVGGQGRS